jgi:hypothetical protein
MMGRLGNYEENASPVWRNNESMGCVVTKSSDKKISATKMICMKARPLLHDLKRLNEVYIMS